jgi:hypothetical protein
MNLAGMHSDALKAIISEEKKNNNIFKVLLLLLLLCANNRKTSTFFVEFSYGKEASFKRALLCGVTIRECVCRVRVRVKLLTRYRVYRRFRLNLGEKKQGNYF